MLHKTMNIQIHQLETTDMDTTLRRLFQILYDNMNPIAPVEDSFDSAYLHWHRVIAHALEDHRRTMLIVCDDEEIVGFFMYACNGLNFLMEEMQLIPRVQSSGIFHAIYAEVLPHLPETVATVEAYAHKNNRRSQEILAHFGLEMIGENKNGSSYRYRGDFREFAFRMNTKQV